MPLPSKLPLFIRDLEKVEEGEQKKTDDNAASPWGGDEGMLGDWVGRSGDKGLLSQTEDHKRRHAAPPGGNAMSALSWGWRSMRMEDAPLPETLTFTRMVKDLCRGRPIDAHASV